MNTFITSFLEEIEQFLAKYDMAPSAFGSKVLKNPSFVKNLRHFKHAPTTTTVEKVRSFMASYNKEHIHTDHKGDE